METELKFKVGDRVRVKSLEWFNSEPKNVYGGIKGGNYTFVSDMRQFCGTILKVTKVLKNSYCVDSNRFYWQDWMLEDDAVTEEKQEVEQLNQNTMETKKMTLKEAQEFVKNTKYLVFTKEQSEELQKKLFEIGCEWHITGTFLCHTEEPFLFVDNDLNIRCSTKSFYREFEKSEKCYVETDYIISVEIKKTKFDPNTLQPFDKVLVRQNENSTWIARFFEFYEICSCGSYHTTSGSTWKYCIPFNDDTKHLHRTCDEAPEFYRI